MISSRFGFGERESVENAYNGMIDEALKDVFKVTKFTNPKDKKEHGKIVVDRGTFDTWKHKKMLDAHGIRWDKFAQTPSVPIWGDSAKYQLNNYIKPALEELAAEFGEDVAGIPDILKMLEDELDAVISGGNVRPLVGAELPNGNKVNTSEIANGLKEKLKEFKMKLLNITSSEEFKERVQAILGFRNRLRANGGHLYSLSNTILIMIQDPDATLVESVGTWNKTFKRTVNSDAKFITLCVRDNNMHGFGNRRANKNDDARVTAEFLAEVGKKSVDELTGIEKDVLRRRKQATKGRFTPFIKFNWVSTFCDVRFTEPMEGTKDEFPNKTSEVDTTDTTEDGKKIDVSWYDDTGYPTKATLELAEAIRRVCKKHNIDFGIEDIRGGARGYSADSGKKIRILANATENADLVKTMLHELTHSLCHWPGSIFTKMKEYGDQEQEAEMTAWLVSMTYGYEETTNTSLNYMAGWGLTNPEIAAKVFDAMMEVVNYEVREINEQLDLIRGENKQNMNNNEQNESVTDESYVGNIDDEISVGGTGINIGIKDNVRRKILGGSATGRDIADMLGLTKIYDRSKKLSK